MADFGIILVFIIGVILGLFYQFFYKKIPKIKTDKLIPTINAQQYFNEIEISIFSKILTSPDKSISSHELNLLINQKNLSSVELNRLKRLILKDLNLKIKIVFGIPNGIWQVDSFEDLKTAQKAVLQAIKTYNELRPHLALKMKKPVELYAA